MDKNTYRKFLMAKIDVAQREIEVTKELVAMLDEGSKGTDVASTPVDVVTEAPKAKKTTKKEAEKAAPVLEKETDETTEVETSLDDDFLNDDEGLSGPTLDDVRKAVKAFAAKHGKQKTEKVLAKFGATAIPQIKEKDYSKVIELVNKYL